MLDILNLRVYIYIYIYKYIRDNQWLARLGGKEPPDVKRMIAVDYSVNNKQLTIHLIYTFFIINYLIILRQLVS